MFTVCFADVLRGLVGEVSIFSRGSRGLGRTHVGSLADENGEGKELDAVAVLEIEAWRLGDLPEGVARSIEVLFLCFLMTTGSLNELAIELVVVQNGFYHAL